MADEDSVDEAQFLQACVFDAVIEVEEDLLGQVLVISVVPITNQRIKYRNLQLVETSDNLDLVFNSEIGDIPFENVKKLVCYKRVFVLGEDRVKACRPREVYEVVSNSLGVIV